MTIREEQQHDHAAVRAVHETAFGDHGATVATLVDALRRDDPAGLSLVSEVDGEVAGHVMATRSRLDAPRKLIEVPVLSPLAVRPDRQRQGIGAALVAETIRRLDERGAPLVFLEGDPAYYSRLSFRAAGELGFRRPSLRIPEVAFQVVLLSGYESWMTGTLVYSATFWDHDCVGLRDPYNAA